MCKNLIWAFSRRSGVAGSNLCFTLYRTEVSKHSGQREKKRFKETDKTCINLQRKYGVNKKIVFTTMNLVVLQHFNMGMNIFQIQDNGSKLAFMNRRHF